MIRPLTHIALIGIATALVCLPLAALLEHHNSAAGRGWSGSSGWHGRWADRWFDGDDFSDDNDARPEDGNAVSRDFAWNGSDRLQLDVPGELHFQAAPTWHLSIRAGARTLDHIVVEDGRIRQKRSYGRAAPIDVQLSGPALREVELNGSGDVILDNLKQPSLDVAIHGSGSARATGSVDALRVRIMGSGSARLAQLAARSAKIFIAGSGAADISPSDAADIFIAGSGDVRLHSHPAQLRSKIAGSGRVVETAGDPGSGDQTT